MSALDVTKERIAYLKLWLGILVVTDISLLGWFASEVGKAQGIRTYIAVIGLVVITLSVFLIHQQIETKIKSMEDV